MITEVQDLECYQLPFGAYPLMGGRVLLSKVLDQAEPTEIPFFPLVRCMGFTKRGDFQKSLGGLNTLD